MNEREIPFKNLTENLLLQADYTEEECARCDKCKFHKSEENKFVDRMWDSVCLVHDRYKLPVKSHGRCRYFDKSALNK